MSKTSFRTWCRRYHLWTPLLIVMLPAGLWAAACEGAWTGANEAFVEARIIWAERGGKD